MKSYSLKDLLSPSSVSTASARFVATVFCVYWLCMESHNICAASVLPDPSRSTAACLTLLILRPGEGNRESGLGCCDEANDGEFWLLTIFSKYLKSNTYQLCCLYACDFFCFGIIKNSNNWLRGLVNFLREKIVFSAPRNILLHSLKKICWQVN